jgi:sirohydrochlorin cobaltochelatase
MQTTSADNASKRAIVLFAHGARDPLWAEPFELLAQRLRTLRPDCEVRLAFLELMSPSLPDCVAELAAQGMHHITIVPAFMSRGAHLRRDLPQIVEGARTQHPEVEIAVTDALGESPAVLDAMAQWITGSL